MSLEIYHLVYLVNHKQVMYLQIEVNDTTSTVLKR